MSVTIEITDYCEMLGLELSVNERTDPNLNKYYATINNVDVKRRSILTGYHGNGENRDEAIKDYCRLLSGEPIVINAFTDKRVEYICPNLIHTKNA